MQKKLERRIFKCLLYTVRFTLYGEFFEFWQMGTIYNHQQNQYTPQNSFMLLFVFNQSEALFFFLKFIHLFWEREKERKWGSRGRAEREGERSPSRLHAGSAEPDAGLQLTNSEIMTWGEIKSQMLESDWATQVPHEWSAFLMYTLYYFIIQYWII